MLDKLLFLLGLAGVAVVYADVLVRDGMLLAPVQRALRDAWRKWWFRWMDSQRRPPAPGKTLGQAVADFGDKAIFYAAHCELDEQWWWKPLWGCPKCVCGQWCLWLYILRYHPHVWHLGWWGWACWLGSLLAFVSWGILAAMALMKFSKWTQE